MTDQDRARLYWLCTEPDPWPEDGEEEADEPPEPVSAKLEARLLATIERVCGPATTPDRGH